LKIIDQVSRIMGILADLLPRLIKGGKRQDVVIRLGHSKSKILVTDEKEIWSSDGK